MITERINQDERFETLSFSYHAVTVVYRARVSLQIKACDKGDSVGKALEETTIPQTVWPAAYPASEKLIDDSSRIFGGRKIKVLEIGSGTGLFGLTAAALGQKVVVTDTNEVSLALLAMHPQVAPRRLRWGNDDDAAAILEEFDGPFDAIIGCDVFYFSASLRAGMKTVSRLLRPGGSFLLASAVRSDEIEDEIERIPETFSAEFVVTAKEDIQCRGGPYPGQVHTKNQFRHVLWMELQRR